MNGSSLGDSDKREALDRLLGDMRPTLHRYAARMTGSVVDGEDVVQEAIMNAIEGFVGAGSIDSTERWLFRITHNVAVDFLRRRTRQEALQSGEDPEVIIDPVATVNDREIVAASLRAFMRLPVAQRSSVILMDVLGYSLEEIGDVTDMTVPAIKAALHRGRSRLRELAREPEDVRPPTLGEPERARLMTYIERFNARDFDSLRDMLADDVRLDLANRLRAKGRSEVGEYFRRYSLSSDWHCAPGFVEGRPAIFMLDPSDLAGSPAYFILLEWEKESVTAIRDFRFARYALKGAELSEMN